MPKILIPFLVALLLPAAPASAYVGPGAGLGAIGLALALVATLAVTLLSFVWFPLKRLARRIRRRLSGASRPSSGPPRAA